MEKVFLVQYSHEVKDVNRFLEKGGKVVSVTSTGDGGKFLIVAFNDE